MVARLVLAAFGAAAAVAAELDAGGACRRAPVRDSALLQTGRRLDTEAPGGCASRLHMWERRSAACVVVRRNRALLVWVPFGDEPGWDLPGGWGRQGEAACQTAEREVCEETGLQVRAVKQVSWNVFQCELVAEGACRNAADEGFLGMRWASLGELGALHLRGGTWGDKRGLLAQALHAEDGLLQTETGLLQSRSAETWPPFGRRRTQGAESDCAQRLGVQHRGNAGCVVVRDGKALLVWVPYGESPGWDLPGGYRHDGEVACETAERETCEESGLRVQTVAQLSDLVFQCEVVEGAGCTNPVDEGFLQRRWVGREELDGVQYRGYTWGDKRGLLAQALSAAPPGSDGGAAVEAPTPAPEASSAEPTPEAEQTVQPTPAASFGDVDVCGCKMCEGQGYSSDAQQCQFKSFTAPDEACACVWQSKATGNAFVDACGCNACEGLGWSSTRRRCHRGSVTSPEEGCECQKAVEQPGSTQIA